MKKAFLFYVSVIFSFVANAQMYLDVVSPMKHLGSVPSKDVIRDNEGNPCAKIMFEMSVADVEFSSPCLVGSATKRTGRYDCFVSVTKQSNAEMSVIHPSYGSVRIPLWCDEQPLIPREAYHIRIDAKVLESFFRKFEEYIPFDDEDDTSVTHRKSIPEVAELSTGNVFNMSMMFLGCTELENLDLSHFNTSNVITMSYMFHLCTNLQSIDLSSFNTSKVTTFEGMFRYCSSISKLNLTNFDTSNAQSMASMFSYCENLRSIDLHNFDTRYVKSMSSMFGGCSNLVLLDLRNFSTNNVTDMSGMFSGCVNLKDINLGSFNTSNVTDMSAMFCDCQATSLDLKSFNTQSVKEMANMFADCKNLSSIDMSNFYISTETDCYGMFRDCNNLKSIKVTNCNQTTINIIKEELIRARILNQVRLIR